MQMSAIITDGWVSGTLPGPGGREYQIKRFAQGPYYSLAQVKPNLVLHTTETDGYVEHLQYPSQWQVGEGIIGQHRPLWAKGEALKGDTTNDPYAMQIEIVGRSQLELWLPKPASLGPLVALMAFFQERGLVKSAVTRPTNWADKLDRGPQATSSYYRRQAGLWPQTAGVYGHVDVPDNDHWDPGSLEYAQLFQMVRDVTNPAGSDAMSDYEKGMAAFATAARAGNPDKPVETDWTTEKKQGYRDARLLYTNPQATTISVGSHNHSTVEVAGPATT
jgi:hypothetical protein